MQNNFKTVNTWAELTDSDKHFLEEWVIYRHTSSADVTDAHRAEALEHWNASPIGLLTVALRCSVSAQEIDTPTSC